MEMAKGSPYKDWTQAARRVEQYQTLCRQCEEVRADMIRRRVSFVHYYCPGCMGTRMTF